MIATLLLLALAGDSLRVFPERREPVIAIDAPSTTADQVEVAFEAEAQRVGQWTTFRAWAEDEAILFAPRITAAKDWLRGRRDPAGAMRWQPAASYVSCDGRMAVNTGAAQWPDGRYGYFTTAWFRQPDRTWRWQVHHAAELSAPRAVPAQPTVRKAACSKPDVARAPVVSTPGDTLIFGGAPDDTLRVRVWSSAAGARALHVELWDGRDFETVLYDAVPAPGGGTGAR